MQKKANVGDLVSFYEYSSWRYQDKGAFKLGIIIEFLTDEYSTQKIAKVFTNGKIEPVWCSYIENIVE